MNERHLSINYPKRPGQGFTFLELMLVVFILGITLVFVIPSLESNSDRTRIEKELKKLAYLIRLAADDATLNARHIGIQIEPGYYQFLIRSGDGAWEPLRDRVLKKVTLPKSLTLKLINRPKLESGAKEDLFEQADAVAPSLMVSKSGEMTPFSLRIINQDKDSYFELIGSFSGHLKINAVEKDE